MSVAEILNEIENLVSPTKGNPCLTIEGAFLQKLNENISDNSLNHLNVLRSSLLIENPFQDEQWSLHIYITRWKYLCNLMEKLLALKSAFACANEKDSLLSVDQFQIIKSSLQILVSFGILANLSPGIGIDLEQRSKFTKDILPNSNSQQKHYCLNVVLRCLMSLREEDTFKRVLVSSYIGDCLAAIFQLILQSSDPNIINDQNNKAYLEKQLSCLLEETSQPILIRELMLLNGNKDCPPKLGRALRLIMTERLMKENGVIATAKAILDVAGNENSPKHWATLSVIAKLIATPHKNQAPNYRDYVYPQILKLLSTSELQYAQIATLCIRTVHEMEPEVCEKCFIDKICSPFLMPTTEEDLNFSIECLYNCIGIPASQHWALSVSLFKKIYISLFRLYCFVVNSASHIKSKLKYIVLAILSNDMDYKGFVFGTISLKFSFGENGGVFTKFNEENEEEMLTPWGDATDILLDLMEDDLNKVKLFQDVITSFDGPIERKVVGARVLSELCTVPGVLKWIEEKPKAIVIFIKSLLENDYDSELICVGLMVLSIFLNSDKKQDWHIFDILVEPLKQFKNKSNNVELKVLADDLYSIIISRGVMKKDLNDKKFSSTLEKPKHGQCTEALAEVTDPLLPVRAHALRTLGKLIIARDPEAERNKEKIFCIFKENLKCDDSYVYLSAVEGLSSFAGMFPDDVLVTLTEQFVHSKDAEIRLKVGEVLIRVIRILGEMAAVYKNEIINALLFGCRDSDHIVRASSLSNLGELCRILSFRINSFLIEIFECIRSIFETDKALEPKRAAVMLLTLLLKGLGSDALQVLEPVLLNIYRLLKFIYNYDKDDITRLHAQLAIEELNASTVMFLRPPQDLKKHIFVLKPPN